MEDEEIYGREAYKCLGRGLICLIFNIILLLLMWLGVVKAEALVPLGLLQLMAFIFYGEYNKYRRKAYDARISKMSLKSVSQVWFELQRGESLYFIKEEFVFILSIKKDCLAVYSYPIKKIGEDGVFNADLIATLEGRDAEGFIHDLLEKHKLPIMKKLILFR